MVRDGVTEFFLVPLDDDLVVLGQALVEVHVEGHLLLVFLENVTREEDIQGVVNAPSQVLYSLTVSLLLLLNFALVDQRRNHGTVLTISNFADLLQSQSLGFRARDLVRYLLVSRRVHLEKDLHHSLADVAQTALACLVVVAILVALRMH